MGEEHEDQAGCKDRQASQWGISAMTHHEICKMIEALVWLDLDDNTIAALVAAAWRTV